MEVVELAWLDERPLCVHLHQAWREKRAVATRCVGYETYRQGSPDEEHRPGYCPMSGGLCAFEDPNWMFRPGWDGWVEFVEEHGYCSADVWPGFRRGDLVTYRVVGDCMLPVYPNGSTVVGRLGDDGFVDDSACIVQWQVMKLPLAGFELKRLTRVGEHWLVTADAPDFEPRLVPRDAVRIVALVVIADVEQLTPFHIFCDGRVERRP